MAATIRGVQPLAWGTETITGVVVDSSTRDASTEEFVIEDEDGQIITQIVGFGEKTEYTWEIIPKSSFTSPPDKGDIFTVGSEKSVILNISKKRVKKDVEKWTIKSVAYPGISLGA